MYVRDYMTTKVITIPSDTLLLDAQKIMQEHGFRRLPVVDNGKLVGIITRTKVRDVSPSPATSLSVWEMHYLLAKMKVKDVMERNLITITPDTTIEDAAILGQKRGIGALPVLENGKMVGIITATDLLKILLEVLGVEQDGVRLHICDAPADKPLSDITDVIYNNKGRIHSLFTVSQPGSQGRDLVIRLIHSEPSGIVEELTKKGYNVETSR